MTLPQRTLDEYLYMLATGGELPPVVPTPEQELGFSRGGDLQNDPLRAQNLELIVCHLIERVLALEVEICQLKKL